VQAVKGTHLEVWPPRSWTCCAGRTSPRWPSPSQAVRAVGHRDKVRKRDLVSTMQVLMRTSRLKVAVALPEAATLVQELLAFQVKIAPHGYDTSGTWREGGHDDLALAVALAYWCGEQAGDSGMC
jgi:hypothetical protein